MLHFLFSTDYEEVTIQDIIQVSTTPSHSIDGLESTSDINTPINQNNINSEVNSTSSMKDTEMYDVVNTQTNQNTEMYDVVNTPPNPNTERSDVLNTPRKACGMVTFQDRQTNENCDKISLTSNGDYENAETQTHQINYEEIEGYEDPVMVYLTCLESSK